MAIKKAAPKKAAASVKATQPVSKAIIKLAPAGGKPAAKKNIQPVPKKIVVPIAKKEMPKKEAPELKKEMKHIKPDLKKISEKNTLPAPVAKKPAPPKTIPSKPVEPVKKPAVEAPSQSEVKPAIKPLEKTPPKSASSLKPAKVVIPKTSTTNSVKYQPEFTKSVLDKNAAVQNGPTQRYSDGELTEFRDLINRKLDTAKKELAYLQGLITRKDESGDMEDGRYMTMEDGSMSMEREQLSQMASRQIQFIDHLEKAIMRIENKTYGICRITGKLIDKARLRAVPHATLSIEAKQMMNK